MEPMNTVACSPPRSALEALPVEVLLQILFHSCTPSLIHVSNHLYQTLPPYVRYTKSLAAIATCPEGPARHDNIMRGVFSRVMEEHYYPSCRAMTQLTLAGRWQIRRHVWSSRWFGARQFETIVLELYRNTFEETLRLLNCSEHMPKELRILREHVMRCRNLPVGSAFVEGVSFSKWMVEGPCGHGPNQRYKGDLSFTFDSIMVLVGSKRDEFTFWGTEHLYDLPDGIFNTPVKMEQLQLIDFLITLNGHRRTRTRQLVPKRNIALGEAVTWAIQERDLLSIRVLSSFWAELRRAGNKEALKVYQHLRESIETKDRQLIECVLRGAELPFMAGDFLDDHLRGAAPIVK